MDGETIDRPIIPYRQSFDPAAEEVASLIRQRRGGHLLNLDRMLLHWPEMAEGWNAFMGRIRGGNRVSDRHRELAICAIAALTGADYEWHQHLPFFVAAGGTAEQVAALSNIADAAYADGVFDAADQAVLALVTDCTRDIRISAGARNALKAAFHSPEEILELVMVVAAYNMVSRVLVGLGVEIEGKEAGRR